MSFADYYRANADDENKLYLYVLYGDSTLPAKFKDLAITIVGKTLEEAKQRWNRMLNNDLVEEDEEIGLNIILLGLNNYTNFRIKKHKVKVKEDGEVIPLTNREIKDEEMMAYEKELLKD